MKEKEVRKEEAREEVVAEMKTPSAIVPEICEEEEKLFQELFRH